jgi:hypothetical protein
VGDFYYELAVRLIDFHYYRFKLWTSVLPWERKTVDSSKKTSVLLFYKRSEVPKHRKSHCKNLFFIYNFLVRISERQWKVFISLVTSLKLFTLDKNELYAPSASNYPKTTWLFFRQLNKIMDGSHTPSWDNRFRRRTDFREPLINWSRKVCAGRTHSHLPTHRARKMCLPMGMTTERPTGSRL